jgi:hypothetical protein
MYALAMQTGEEKHRCEFGTLLIRNDNLFRWPVGKVSRNHLQGHTSRHEEGLDLHLELVVKRGSVGGNDSSTEREITAGSCDIRPCLLEGLPVNDVVAVAERKYEGRGETSANGGFGRRVEVFASKDCQPRQKKADDDESRECMHKMRGFGVQI